MGGWDKLFCLNLHSSIHFLFFIRFHLTLVRVLLLTLKNYVHWSCLEKIILWEQIFYLHKLIISVDMTLNLDIRITTKLINLEHLFRSFLQSILINWCSRWFLEDRLFKHPWFLNFFFFKFLSFFKFF
jgi:hypothetical protein